MARAACDTNLAQIIDLSSWTVVNYDVTTAQPAASWVLSQSNTVALQGINADPSIFLSPFVLTNDRIQGSWLVNTNDDDDFMGFVFGFQDSRHFYLFDWKQGGQTNSIWGNAISERGMSVKVVNASSTLTGYDFAATLHTNQSRIRSLYHNTIPYVDFVSYDFDLEFQPGHFTITVRNGTNILDIISIDDATYTSGQFGFYNFSQGQVRYAGFTRRLLPPRPLVSVADRAVVEGDSGTINLVFTVTLSITNCDPTLVDYVITPGSATAGEDYVATTAGTLLFAPGETNQFVAISVLGDRLNEPDETLFITLSNAVGGAISAGLAVGTILNDDPFPTLFIEDVTVVEGDSGSTQAMFSVTLSAPSGQAIQVDYSTFDGTAVAGIDYLALAPSVLLFPPGQTSAMVSVTVIGDPRIEPDETMFVCLTNAVNVTLSRTCATGLLRNDDTNKPPTVSLLQPVEGAEFSAPPSLVAMAAAPRDLDGFIIRVDFYVGTTFVGASTNAPWTTAWTASLPGLYTLTAIATDDAGGRGTSAPVHITVRPCDPNLNATPLVNQTRCICDEVQFSTTVTNVDPVTYAWRANGIMLAGETNRTLLLQDLHQAQAGTYTVEIRSACATITRSATLTLKGAGNQNPVAFTNSSLIAIPQSGVAAPYPASLLVECVPGPVKHLAVTLDGLSHSFPDDVDVLLVSPTGASVKLLSDCGGNQKLTNVVLSFSDTATEPLPDALRIFPGHYRPTDYAPTDTFLSPAPASGSATNFLPFLGLNPNGVWSLFVLDDNGGDSGQILRGWSLSIEWEDTPPRLADAQWLPDGRFQMTLHGLAQMTHVIEASFDLATWLPVRTNAPGASIVPIVLPVAGGGPARFFRAVRCP